jgi:hypothetical protein
MKKFVSAFALVFLAFAMSSCVQIAYGPSDGIVDAEYVQSVQPIVGSEETIKFMNKGYLLGNTAAPGPAQTWGVFGTIVVTDKTLYFFYWKPKTKVFEVIRKLPIIDMVNIKHISSIWGPGDYLSIEDKDHRFDLLSRYEIPFSGNRNLVEKNRELLNSISAVRNAE